MSYDDFTTLSVTRDNGVAFATISYGELNLLDIDMLADLDRLGRTVEQDDAVKVLVLQSANPDFFVAHADLDTVAALPSEPAPREQKLGWINRVFDRFRTMPKVSIAKIAGRARLPGRPPRGGGSHA